MKRRESIIFNVSCGSFKILSPGIISLYPHQSHKMAELEK